MKKFLGWVGVVAGMCLATNADASAMYAGVKGGVNIASLSGDGTDGLDSRTGFTGGAFYGFEFAKNFDVRIEGLYTQKGAEGEFVIPGDDHSHESKVKLDYIEFPVLFVANFPAGEKAAFNLFAGPTFGFNTTAEVEVIEHNETEDLSDEVSSFEFGAAIGGGVEYAMSSFSLLLDVRYSLGATNIPDEGDTDLKNRGIGIMAGVKFPLGSK